MNDCAIITIKINCDKELQHHIHHFTDVRKIWLYIKKHYRQFISAKEIEFFMKLTRMQFDEHSNMRSYFVTVYDYIEKINWQISNQFFQDWMTCLLLVKEFSFKYNIWISQFMKKIENSTHYHNVLKFEKFKIVLTVEEAWMNSDSVTEKANIMQAFKERFYQ